MKIGKIGCGTWIGFYLLAVLIGGVLSAMNGLAAKPSPLEAALIRQDSYEVVRLLENGADPNEIGQSGQPVIGETLRMNHYDLAEILLAFGADLSRKNLKGETVLEQARKARDKGAVRWIEARLQRGQHP